MPIYLFSNPENENEVVEVVMSVHDDHVFFRDGVKWNRLYTVPTSSVDTKWNPDNPKDFVEKSKKYKGGTIGDLWEKSAELSKKRERVMGADPLKQKYYENFKKTHGNKDHPDIKKQKLKDSLAKNKMFGWKD